MVKMADLPGKVVSFYDIEKDIPIPKGRSPRHELNHKVKTMEIGDSMLIPNVRNSLKHNLERATGYKFTQRVVPEGIRIWRIE